MNLTELARIYDFTGRSVIVTGGTGVLGRVMIHALIGCGANVGVVARNREKAEDLVSKLDGPGRAIIVSADVLNREQLEQARQTIVAEFGREPLPIQIFLSLISLTTPCDTCSI